MKDLYVCCVWIRSGCGSWLMTHDSMVWGLDGDKIWNVRMICIDDDDDDNCGSWVVRADKSISTMTMTPCVWFLRWHPWEEACDIYTPRQCPWFAFVCSMCVHILRSLADQPKAILYTDHRVALSLWYKGLSLRNCSQWPSVCIV